MKKLLLVFVCLISYTLLQANDYYGVEMFSYEPDPLTEAIENNDYTQVKTLIEKGTDVTKPSTSRQPMLCVAKNSHQNKDIIKLLVEHGADVNSKCYYAETVLHGIVGKSQNLELVKFLVEKGADVNAKDESGNTPLCYTGTKEIAKYLIEKGADVNILNKDGGSWLVHMLPYGKNNEKLKLFEYVFPQVQNADKNTLLLKAVENNNLEIVKLLVKNGADVNSVDKNNISVLAKAKNNKIAKYLVSKGAKINNIKEALAAGDTEAAKEFINKGNYSVEKLNELLFESASYDAADISKYLIEKGANVNAKIDGKTPLFPSSMAGNFKTVKLLVEKGANVNAKYEGANPLYFAAMNSHNKVIKYLIEKGSEVNILFDRIYPILFHPCKECQKETIEILMKNKADANIIMGNLTMAGLVAFNENKNCSLKKKEETLRMMIKYGADINIIAPPGINALDMAIMQNNADIEKMLIKLGAKSNQAIGMHAVANNKEMILFLLENGFDINAKNSYGETALDQKITDEIKQFLISHGAKSGKDLK